MSLDASGDELWCCRECHAIYRKGFPYCPNDGAEVVRKTVDPVVGTTLEHYDIDELIGEGANARVYRAHHTHLVHKQYAVKVLLGEVAATQEERSRFAQEAELASRLSHQNVVSVIDFARTKNGLLYLVMELVDGLPLSTVIEQGPMQPLRVAKLARGVCAGLIHAHGLGLIHRDLKPDNIVVVTGPDGEVPRIVDFGLAIEARSDRARLTSRGLAVGTPAYVAPEQVCGMAIDARADQYGLGVTMFEMLTGGALPFEGDPVDLVTAKAQRDAPPIELSLPPGVAVPQALSSLIARMISRTPDARFEHLRDVVAALDQWMGAPCPERPNTTPAVAAYAATEPSRLVSPSRRPTRFAALGIAVVCGAVAVTAVLRSSPAEVAATSIPATPRWTREQPGATASIVPKVAITDAPAVQEARLRETAVQEARLREAAVQEARLREPAVQEAKMIAAPLREAKMIAAPLREAKMIAGTSPLRHGKDRPSTHPRRPTALGATEQTATNASRHESVAPQQVPIVFVPATPSLPPAPSPAPPPALVVLQARVLGVDVSGSLSPAVVKRAIDRVSPSLRRCTTTTAVPHELELRFTIDESGRPRDIHGGAASATLPCLIAAISGLRTESAPDVGEASVVVQIAFRVGK